MRNCGYARETLRWLKNELGKQNIGLFVKDITNFAFPFWVKMFDENMIDDILFDGITLKQLNNKEISENDNARYLYECLNLYRELDNKYDYLDKLYENNFFIKKN